MVADPQWQARGQAHDVRTSMRVLIVNPGRALGGAEQSLLLLLAELQTRGVEATVVVFGEGPFSDRLSSLGVPTVTVRPSRFVRRVGRYRLPRTPFRCIGLAAAALPLVSHLAVLAKRLGARVIHTNGMKAHLLAGLAGRLVDVPIIWHARDFPPRGWTGRVIEAASRALPSVVLTPSAALAARLGGRSGKGPRIVTLYDPVDLGRFHPAVPRAPIRRELRISGDDVPLVGLVAHLTPWKGHEVFLAIARAIADVVPRAHFVVVGGAIYETDGHTGYPEALQRQAAALGLTERVDFLGARDDIPEILAGLDILVHCPTAPEPFGRVLAEAMAVGRPVVAARCGGIPEIVEDGVTGLLVPPGDVKAFAAAALRLVQDPTLSSRIGRAGRRRAEALFGVEAHTTAVLEAYRAVAFTSRTMA